MDSDSLPDVGAELGQDDAANISSSSDFAVHDDDERQDEAGLLSPGTNNANLAVPGLVVTSRGGGESGPASLSLSLSSRSRSKNRFFDTIKSSFFSSSITFICACGPISSEFTWCRGTITSANAAQACFVCDESCCGWWNTAIDHGEVGGGSFFFTSGGA